MSSGVINHFTIKASTLAVSVCYLPNPVVSLLFFVLLKAENILTWRNQGYFYFYVIAQSLMLTLTHNNIYNKYPIKPHFYIVKLGFAGETYVPYF